MATQYQVIQFVVVQFLGDWKRSFSADAGVVYQALAPANQLLVVKETGQGVATTYEFVLHAGAEVNIIEEDIHIPALCVKQEQGNAVKCKG